MKFKKIGHPKNDIGSVFHAESESVFDMTCLLPNMATI